MLPPELPPPPARFAKKSSSPVDSNVLHNYSRTAPREERAALHAQMETMLQQMAALKKELVEKREGSVRNR
jgi:hypothetical protein